MRVVQQNRYSVVVICSLAAEQVMQKVKFLLCLATHHAVKVYGGVDV
jgi:hypothetical protein